MADSAATATDAPPKPKRSFFKKPSWKQTLDSAEDDDPMAMFDGSKQTFSAIMEEQDRARKKKLQEEEESARKKELEVARQGKRRKVTRNEASDSDEDQVRAKQDDRERSRTMTPADRTSPYRLSPSPPTQTNANSLSARYEAATKAKKDTPKQAVIIDLGDSDSDDDVSPPAPEPTDQVTQAPPTDPNDDIDESDAEIREMILEKRRRRRQETNPPVGIDNHSVSSPGAARDSSTPFSPAPPDPTVRILVTSRIPNTRPLIVTRRITQRLQEVREAWCKRQGFDQAMMNSVFFTYKGRKLFDVATCKSLGLAVDSIGRVYMKGNPDWDENDSNIAVDAVTPEIHQENLREAQRQREPEPEPEFEPEPEPEVQQKRIKVIIKTKDFGEAKFTANEDTTFERLVGSSIRKLKLPADKRPYLLFDGERLEPSGTMTDLDEFEDGDALEMHFD